ncbi:hypothetical protein P7C70_g1525, partial [Phenoliferia sp. Uapishka_3]
MCTISDDTEFRQLGTPILPPEVIDKILEQLVTPLHTCLELDPSGLRSHADRITSLTLKSMLAFDREYNPRRFQSAGARELSTASLVCRAWRGVAQQRLFDTLMVKSGSQGTELILEDFMDLGLNLGVKKLVFRSDQIAGSHGTDNISISQLFILLRHLPNVITLSIMLPGPFDFSGNTEEYAWVTAKQLITDSLGVCECLQNLKTLNIITLSGSRCADIVHSIFESTPNLEELSFSATNAESDLNVSFPPINLPHLARLHLGNGTTIASLQAFLTPSTIARITELSWEYHGWQHGDRGSALPFLRLVGPSLRKLTYSYELAHNVAGRPDLVAELKPCLVLEDLTLLIGKGLVYGAIETLPSTIKTLAVKDWSQAVGLLSKRWKDSRVPSSLRVLRILNAEGKDVKGEKTLVKKFCAQAGLKLIGQSWCLWLPRRTN